MVNVAYIEDIKQMRKKLWEI